MNLWSTNKATPSLWGDAFCVGQGGAREAGGGHEAKRIALQALKEEVLNV
ncbi:hypothetical protein MCEMIEM13_02954 [Comamonadaceae bacterium]